MASSSLPLPDLTLLSPQPSSKRQLRLSRLPLSIISISRRHSRYDFSIRTRILALKEEGAVVEDREHELIKEVNGSLKMKGNATAVATSFGDTRDYTYDGLNGGYRNGGVTVVDSESECDSGLSSNGSLVKYVNGNGAVAEVLNEAGDSLETEKEEGRRKRIEEIGKEDAWFKRSAQEELEVSIVMPLFLLFFVC